jgi:Kdo2-lipid IVA lauroyltransferase/acyltransferase
MRYRLKVVLENLRNSFPEKTEKEIKQIARGFYLNLADVIVETIKSYNISKEELKKRNHVTNPEILAQYGNRGQSVLVMASHQCNWEWQLLSAQAHFDFPCDGVYKPLANKTIDEIMLHIRGRLGYRPIPKKSAVREIVRRKDKTFVYGLLGDQRPSPNENNYWVKFLNQDTAFLQGTERIAQLTGFPVLYIDMKRLKRGFYEITFHRIAEAPYSSDSHDILEQYAHLIENSIRRSPSDWLWSHKRWKHKKR